MDRNYFLALALSLLVLTSWMVWQERQHPRPIAEAPAAGPDAAPGPGPQTPAAAPAPTVPAQTARATTPTAASAAAPVMPPAEERLIRVDQPLYVAEVSSRGGALVHWQLKEFFDASVPGHPPVELTTVDDRGQAALVTRLDELGLGDLQGVDFSVTQPDAATVIFERSNAGVTLRKTYTFGPNPYEFRLRLEVANASSATVSPTLGVQWFARHRAGPDFADHALSVLHAGDYLHIPVSAVGQPGFFAKLGGAQPGQVQRYPSDVEWAGVTSRYFVGALKPDVPREASAEIAPLEAGKSATVSITMAPFAVPPGQSGAREFTGYLGPKQTALLESASIPGLERSIALGYWWVTPLTRGFTWLLHACHAVIPNYGIAIILLTVLVRLVTAPLTAKQIRSTKRMGELQPKVKALQEKYADDRERQSQEMMKLYRESGVNPLGGCLPMLLQFPVFIGLYYALQSSIDLRQAPFFGWITDLSVPEQLFVLPGLDVPVRLLPLIMGASMVLQQRLTPTTMDPAQARMMTTVMPVMFTVLFYQFPSGLVLYWLVSNLLAIGHQFLLQREPQKT